MRLLFALFTNASSRRLHGRLSAFAGSDPDADKVVLQGRTAKCEIVTGSKDAPKPSVKVRDAIDVNLTWLLAHLDDGNVVNFRIEREQKECKTPRRNAQVTSAIDFFERFEAFAASVTDMAPIEYPAGEPRDAGD